MQAIFAHIIKGKSITIKYFLQCHLQGQQTKELSQTKAMMAVSPSRANTKHESTFNIYIYRKFPKGVIFKGDN